MKKRFVTIMVCVLGFCLSAGAQTIQDTGTWLNFQFVKRLGKQGPAPYLMARAEHRSFKNISKTECFFLMAGGGYAFSKYFQSDLSYEFWSLPGYNINSTHKGVLCCTESIGSGPLGVSFKEKYELAYNPAASSYSHTLRLRSRIDYTFPKVIVKPFIMNEIFVNLADATWVRSLHYLGAEFRVSQHSGIDLYYMFHMFNTAAGVSGQNVIGVGYTLAL